MKITLSVLAVVICFGLLTGCRGDISPGSNEVKEDYSRVVCMAPSITEIVFALGEGDRVVGVSDFSTYPPEADDLPRCGGYMNPNFELILSLSPDLIFVQGRPGEFEKFSRRYGIKVVALEIDDLQSVYDSINTIAEVLSVGESAKELVGDMQGRLGEIVTELQAPEKPIPTLLVVGRDPSSLREVHVVGPGGFLHDLLKLAGGENIMADLGRQYGSVSKEIIAERNPEVIIELHGEGMMEEDQRRRYLRVWQDMSTLPAVKNERIYVIEETFAMLPGPRSVKIAERMAEILWEDR